MSDETMTDVGPGKDARNWAMFSHLSAFAAFVVPFGNIIGPLIIWLIKREEMPFVNDQGKESLNFQITVLLVAVVCSLLMFVLIGFLLLFALAVYWLVMVIVAAIRASEGKTYRYPYTLRLIK